MNRFKKQNNLMLEDVLLIHCNFTGQKSMYNANGDRTFSVLLTTNEQIETAKRMGFNVKQLKPLEEGDEPAWFIPVKINFKGPRPPRVFVVQVDDEGNVVKKDQYSEATVGALDSLTIVSADVVVNAYHWDYNGETGVKAYLDTLYAVIEQSAFDIKYSGAPAVCLGCELDE